MNKKKRNITQNKYVFIGMTEIRKKAYFSQYKRRKCKNENHLVAKIYRVIF